MLEKSYSKSIGLLDFGDAFIIFLDLPTFLRVLYFKMISIKDSV